MAPVTIVEFSDFQCPHCARAQPVLEALVAKHKGKVRLIFKHFPLPGHPRAFYAARAAEAARLQGKFWEMHDLLFQHQDALQDSDLIGYAEQLNLDVERFKEDANSEAVAKRISKNQDTGRQVGVEGTPTLFVNGHQFMESPADLDAYVQEELEM